MASPAPPEPADQAALAVELEVVDGGLDVRIELSDPQLRRLTLTRPRGDVENLSLEDEDGPLAGEVFVENGARVVELPRAPHGRVRLSYRVEAPVGDPAFFVDAEHEELHAMGEAVLWLPSSDRVQPTRLEVVPAWGRVATSFGLGPVVVTEISPDALRQMDVVVGALRRARFRTPEADDELAALGPVAFDPRWVAAETAGVRSRISEYFEVFDERPFTTLIVGGRRLPNTPSYAAELRTRSLVVDADGWAAWDASARLSVAHALAHRWLGGRLRVETGEASGEGAWFTQGFSRHVAREVLFDIGLLDDDEMIAELDGLEAIVTASPLAGLSNAELVAEGSPEAVRLVTARGALYAARLDLQIAESNERTSGLASLLARWIRGESAVLSEAEFERELVRVAGESELEAFEAMVLDGEPVEVPAGAFGPCYYPIRGRHHPFVLGFVDPGFHGEPIEVRGVVPEGPAHAAGLQSGDVIVALEYVPGHPDHPVSMMVERDGAHHALQYFPRGPTVVGRRWKRNARVPDEACVQ